MQFVQWWRVSKHTVDQVVEAIRGSRGIKRTVALRLSVHRNTVDVYLRRWAAARLAYVEECESFGDVAESVIIKAIDDGDVDTAKWYARMKLKHRGYVERTEHVSKDETLEVVTRVVRSRSDQAGD